MDNLYETGAGLSMRHSSLRRTKTLGPTETVVHS
jgi:hypothetical protein